MVLIVDAGFKGPATAGVAVGTTDISTGSNPDCSRALTVAQYNKALVTYNNAHKVLLTYIGRMWLNAGHGGAGDRVRRSAQRVALTARLVTLPIGLCTGLIKW